MTIVLEPEMEVYIKSKVGTGRFKSESEVMQNAMQLFREKEQLRDAQIRLLNEKLEEARISIERGELFDGDEVFDELLTELDEEETAPTSR